MRSVASFPNPQPAAGGVVSCRRLPSDPGVRQLFRALETSLDCLGVLQRFVFPTRTLKSVVDVPLTGSITKAG